jgi:hypothetical protein
MRKNLFRIAAVTAIVLSSLSINCYSGEHPEHPTGKKKEAKLNKEQLADAIETYIQKEAAANDGNFPIADEKTGEKLMMKLVKVHRERLSKVGADEYFACVDFKSDKGKESQSRKNPKKNQKRSQTHHPKKSPKRNPGNTRPNIPSKNQRAGRKLNNEKDLEDCGNPQCRRRSSIAQEVLFTSESNH